MRARLVRLVFFAGLSLLATTARAQAQDPLDRFLGRVVTSVKLEIEDRPVTSDALLAQLDVHQGDTLTLEALRRTEQRLSSDPRFVDVQALAAETPGGVDLTFRLIPRHPVDDIEFSGETGLDPGELERLVRDQYGGVPTSTRVRDVEDTVRRILADEGFRAATVTSRTEETHNPDRATLVLSVTAGPRTTIRSIKVEGTSPLSQQTILQRTGAAPGLPFRERAVATELSKIRDDLRNRGYYAAIATYTPPPVDGTEVDLTLRVDAGPHVELRIDPEDHLPGGKRDDFIPIQREGSIDQDLLDDSRDAIRSALRREGYWKADVRHEESRPAPDELVITFKISRGKRYRIAAVELPPSLRITSAMIEKAPSLRPGEWFSEALALAALARLVDLQYIQHGYHRAQPAPEFVDTAGRGPDEGAVIIRPNIIEGPRAIIADVVFDLGEQPIVTADQLRAVMQMKRNDPYVLASVQRDADAIAAYYSNRGFQPTESSVVARLNDTMTEATVTVRVREGPQLFVGEITVVGNDRISRETILTEITLQPGQPYSEETRLESQRRLSRLGSFRNLRIIPEPRLPGENAIRLTISVEELPATTIGGGGGLEVGDRARTTPSGGSEDRIEFSPRAFFEIGRRNLGGRNREVSFFSRVALKPKTVREPGQGLGFNEYRVTGTYRERYAFRTNTDLLFAVTSEQQIRTTFSFLRQVANADVLHAVTPGVSVSGRYALEFTRLFDRIEDNSPEFPIDRFFPQLRLSILSSGILWNRRNDPIAPTSGFQLGANGDLALRQIGSEVGFAKGFFQASFFHPLTSNRRAVLATRGRIGLARGFERVVTRIDADGQPVTEIVKDVPANQRFYAGGSTTVRGFQLDRLGVPEVLTADGLSNGGNAEIILNSELRTNVGKLFNRSLTVVGFVDGGQVYRLAGDLDLGRLRGAAGFGVRYDSPLGPVRFDLGFKMNRIVYANGRRERGWEYHFSIGEAF